MQFPPCSGLTSFKTLPPFLKGLFKNLCPLTISSYRPSVRMPTLNSKSSEYTENEESVNRSKLCDGMSIDNLKIIGVPNIKHCDSDHSKMQHQQIDSEVINSEFLENNPEIIKTTLSESQVELSEDDLDDIQVEEDYETKRNKNIKEKEKMLATLFKGVEMFEIMRNPSTKLNRSYIRKPAIKIDKPRRHLPRRNASKSASLRSPMNSDDEEDENILDNEEISPSSKRRKVVFAPRPVSKAPDSGPRLILQAEDVTEEDLRKVADHVTQKKYSQNGSTCHQCRQKTLDLKTVCRSQSCTGIRGLFCGPCLRNRYGEEAREALKDPVWNCPPCRGICNCSICRNRAGANATGILTPLAKKFGYASVKEYLTDHDTFIIKYDD